MKGSLDWEPSGFEAVLLGVIPLTAAGMVLLGLYVSNRSLRLGPSLVAIGTAIMAGVWFWLFFILVPAGIVVTGFAVIRARRLASDRDSTAPG